MSVSHSAIITFQGSSEIREQKERLSEDLSRPALFVTSFNKELVKAEGCETELIRWVAVGWARDRDRNNLNNRLHSQQF